jgi:hypothetical protein
LQLGAWGCYRVLAEASEHSPVIKILNQRHYQHFGHHYGRHFDQVLWSEMVKSLVTPIEPVRRSAGSGPGNNNHGNALLFFL